MRGDIRDKVRKLLNQAADREGTPEGDAFRDKAFALIAQYGLDPAKLGDPADAGAEMTVVELDLSGSYQRQQIGLLNALGQALHCEVIYWGGGGHGYGRSAARGTVIGAARHVERVQLLFSVLCPHMLAGAADLRAGNSAVTARWRRSFMVGFATVVGDRLAAQERSAAGEATRAAQAGGRGRDRRGAGAEKRRGQGSRGNPQALPVPAPDAVQRPARRRRVHARVRRRAPHGSGADPDGCAAGAGGVRGRSRPPVGTASSVPPACGCA
nr:DUF2786 domain-containing protein [Corynebacterium xerosis]